MAVVVALFGLSALTASAAPTFVGAEKCKMCHNSPAKGAQFTKWSESKHAKAFATLATEYGAPTRLVQLAGRQYRLTLTGDSQHG